VKSEKDNSMKDYENEVVDFVAGQESKGHIRTADANGKFRVDWVRDKHSAGLLLGVFSYGQSWWHM